MLQIHAYTCCNDSPARWRTRAGRPNKRHLQITNGQTANLAPPMAGETPPTAGETPPTACAGRGWR
eukprot:6435072-Lingulodinium_polyedra.AAC.1